MASTPAFVCVLLAAVILAACVPLEVQGARPMLSASLRGQCSSAGGVNLFP